MDRIDPQQARQVWQRVQAGQSPEENEDALARLSAGEWEAAAMLELLARRTGGKYPTALRALAGHSRSRWACLQAMALLRDGKRLAHVHPDSTGAAAQELLRRCCENSLTRLHLYEAQTGRGGSVMMLLAQEQARDYRALLELLGNWQDHPPGLPR